MPVVQEADIEHFIPSFQKDLTTYHFCIYSNKFHYIH